MTQYLVILVIASGITIFATPPIRRLALKSGFVDEPSQRKLHVEPVPLMGGLAIFCGIAAAVWVADLGAEARELPGTVIGMLLVTALGLLDDRFSLPPIVKFVGLIVVAGVFMALTGLQVTLLANHWMNLAVTVLWIVGIANAINFLDNMDGLAAGLASVAAAFFMLIAMIEDLPLSAALGAATLGACIGFLFHNFEPATLFMGDAGSLLLGYALAVLGLQVRFAGRPLGSTWMIPIVVLALPIFDTTLVVISRLRTRRPIYVGGKDHVSHRLVSRLAMSKARGVMALYYIAVLLGMFGLIMREMQPQNAQLLGLALALTFVAGLVWLDWGYVYHPDQPNTENTPDNDNP